MSTYLDPSTALTIARAARAEEIKAAEQYHLTHPRSDHRETSSHWRIPWKLRWPRPAVAA